MKKIIFILCLLFFSAVTASSQEIDLMKRLKYESSVAIGASRFHSYKFPAMPDYPTAEAQVLFLAGKPLNNKFTIFTGIGLSYKFNRESYYSYEYPNDSIVVRVSRKQNVFPRMDETVSKGGRISIDIPIYLTYATRKNKIRVGPVMRFWQENGDKKIDILDNQSLLGIQLEISKRFSPRNEIGVLVHHNLFSFQSVSIFTPTGHFLDYDTYNQNIQLRLTHRFN